jgi:hypothetical protein
VGSDATTAAVSVISKRIVGKRVEGKKDKVPSRSRNQEIVDQLKRTP